MSSSTRTALLASLLVVGAITLGLTRNPDDTKPDRQKSPIPTLTRAKLPNRRATISQLLSSKGESQDRKSWAKSLSDEDLRRLTLEMIDAYQSDDDRSKTTPWLTSLAMEWGRRDFDGFLEESTKEIFQGDQDGWSKFGIFVSLKTAALVGLSEDEPSSAWALFNDDNPTGNIRTSDDFIQAGVTITGSTLTAEAIFRSWAKIDAASAWKELSSSDKRDTFKLAAAMRGLLAETKNAELRKTILKWTEEFDPSLDIPGIPRSPGTEVISIYDVPSRSEDGAITRNSIDSILNNPNRTHHDPDALPIAVALGLAEHNFEAALDEIQQDNVLPPIGLSPSERSHRYFAELADRSPSQVLDFLNDPQTVLSDNDRAGAATGLFNHDPTAALNAFSSIKNPSSRLEFFNDWIQSTPWLGRTEPWPLIDGMQTYVPVSEALQSLEQNISRLGLSPQSEQKAIEALRSLATRSDGFTIGGFEFPSESE